jgi:hypothetical protein
LEPKVEQMGLPAVYGHPKKKLAWSDVRKDLAGALVYWVASVRPDGRPHVVPKDGVWLDDTLFYGGADETVHHRNVDKNPEVTMHVGEGLKAIIVEGSVEKIVPPRDLAQRLADATNVKYAHYGMKNTAETYDSGIWALTPRRVLAWNVLFQDATRFTF